MTLEAAIAAAHAAGYRIHNLFERESGGWQANLSARTAKGRVYSEFAIAAAPELALTEALRQAAPLMDDLKTAYTIVTALPPVVPKAVEDALSGATHAPGISLFD